MIYNIITYEKIYILIVSFFLDLFFGEPKNKYHPVVWIGNIIHYLKKKSTIIKNEKLFGFLIVLIVIFFSLIILSFVILFSKKISFFCYLLKIIIFSFFFKCTFAIKSMIDPSIDMYKKLIKNNKFNNKCLNTYVSRDTSNLKREHI